MRDLTIEEVEAVAGGWGSMLPGEEDLLYSALAAHGWTPPSSDPYEQLEAEMGAQDFINALPPGQQFAATLSWLATGSPIDTRFADPNSVQNGLIRITVPGAPDDPNTPELEVNVRTVWVPFVNGPDGLPAGLQTIQSWSTYQQDTRNEGYDYNPPVQMVDYTSEDGRLFEQIYPPGLYQVEFTPLVPRGVGAGEHRHFVYVPADGGPAEIISGNAVMGRLTVIVSQLAGSAHDLNSAAGRNSMDVFRLDVPANQVSTIWSGMSAWGGVINDANLTYNITNMNSNSVFRTLTDLFGLQVDNVGGAAGFDNNLMDEVLSDPPDPGS